MIHITERAVKAIKQTYQEANLPDETFVRISMKAGGCSGFDVSMEPDQTSPTRYDLTFNNNGVNIVVDKKSHIYLNGMEVDYVMEGFSGGFKFNPPNATAACGCGTSFAFNKPKKEGSSIPELNFSI